MLPSNSVGKAYNHWPHLRWRTPNSQKLKKTGQPLVQRLFVSTACRITTLMGVPPLVQPIFVSFPFRITVLHKSCGCATLRAGYIFYLYAFAWFLALYTKYKSDTRDMGAPNIRAASVFRLSLHHH